MHKHSPTIQNVDDHDDDDKSFWKADIFEKLTFRTENIGKFKQQKKSKDENYKYVLTIRPF